MDPRNPDLVSLAATVGQAVELLREDATAEQWQSFTLDLERRYTASELANMLTGAATLIALNARNGGGPASIAVPATKTPPRPGTPRELAVAR